MAESWVDSVKRSGHLIVEVGSMAGSWASVFREAMQAFNDLSRAHGLGVRLSRPGHGSGAQGGANVRVESSSGQIACSYGGARHSESFDGHRMHGRTFLFSRAGNIEKAFVFLPGHPQVNTPRGMRSVGANIMKVIAVHELVHACGLSNHDHSTDDLFQSNPNVDPGSTPTTDRVRIQLRNRVVFMPPLILSGSTIQKIRAVWR